VVKSCSPARFYVTENGAAFDDKVEKNSRIEDDDRTRFLLDHMIAAKRAIRDGITLKGYFVWYLLDSFEWANGYAKRFGLVHISYRTEGCPREEFLLT
jgi:beta-glucosidase